MTKLEKFLKSFFAYAVVILAGQYLWDGVFPGYGAPGYTHYTMFANLVMSVMTAVIYHTLISLAFAFVPAPKVTRLGVVDTSRSIELLNELIKAATAEEKKV
jgi:hypothetical protein